jgi:hypothetical protein
MIDSRREDIICSSPPMSKIIFEHCGNQNKSQYGPENRMSISSGWMISFATAPA